MGRGRRSGTVHVTKAFSARNVFGEIWQLGIHGKRQGS